MLLYATLSLSQSVICPLVFLSNRLLYELEYILFTSKHGILIKECYHVKMFFFSLVRQWISDLHLLFMLFRHLHNILNMNMHCLFQYWVVAFNHIFGVSTFTNNQHLFS